MQLEVQSTEGAPSVHLQPSLSAFAVENMSTRQSLDDFIWMVIGVYLSGYLQTLFEAFDADRAGLFGFAHLHGLDFLVEGMRQSIGFGENLVIFDIERQSLILTPSYEYMFDNALFSSFEGLRIRGLHSYNIYLLLIYLHLQRHTRVILKKVVKQYRGQSPSKQFILEKSYHPGTFLISVISINQRQILNMRKIGEEIRFQQTTNFIHRQLTTLEKNPTEDRVAVLENRLKELTKTVNKIEENFMADRKLNRVDAKHKVDQYKDQVNDLRRKFQRISQQYQKRLLFRQEAYEDSGKLKNFRMMDELNEGVNFIERDFEQTAGIIKGTKQEVGEQRSKMQAIGHEYEDADVELTVIGQFMRMISNRNLLTKIILILLALFLGLADITILCLKIA